MPKCLVDVDGRSILDWQLRALAEAWVTNAAVVVGYRARRVQAHLDATAPPLPVDLVYNPFWRVASSIGSVWAARDHLDGPFVLRSEEHTSELQSLMRISYAVFCLKKKRTYYMSTEV